MYVRPSFTGRCGQCSVSGVPMGSDRSPRCVREDGDFGTAVLVERQKLGQKPGGELKLFGAGAGRHRGRGAEHPGARDDGDLAEGRAGKGPSRLS